MSAKATTLTRWGVLGRRGKYHEVPHGATVALCGATSALSPCRLGDEHRWYAAENDLIRKRCEGKGTA